MGHGVRPRKCAVMFRLRHCRAIWVCGRIRRISTNSGATVVVNGVAEDYRIRKTSNVDHYYPPLRSLCDSDERLRVSEYLTTYGLIAYDELLHKRVERNVNLMGKVNSIRKAGKGMIFVDLVQDHVSVQIMASNRLMGLTPQQFHQQHQDIKKGDYISCIGFPSVTNTGELTLKLNQAVQIVAPCLNSMKLPDRLVNKLLINTNRVLHYLTDHSARDKIIIRLIIINKFRAFFQQKQFLEVTTPLLNGSGTGANAQPFSTTSRAVDHDLQLRVAPELWLKRLVISGFEKIFEIGSSFRNEGIDATHNPEFTTCEFYCSCIDLPQLMELTQDLFSQIYTELALKNIPTLQQVLPKLKPLTMAYDAYEFVPTLEKITGKQLPLELTPQALVAYTESLNLPLPHIKSPSNLLDNLCGVFLETLNSNTYKPFFIYNHPAVLSPLSKSMEMNYGQRKYDISLRFELFINGKEYVNAYEEENSPFEQRKKFELQQRAKADFNDQEMLIPDWNYLKLLEYALPPTGGWGCGIDRLAMLFSDSERIEEVLLFGTIKDVLRN